ncbi:MAG: hypothetical protein ACOYNN_04990 [Terrimicrobiaceae bacterium]|jgi:hypothetical protein
MRRDINWKMKREDGDFYEVRAVWFGAEFKLQFQEKNSVEWDYQRKPSLEDLEALADAIERRYQRKRATLEVRQAAQKMLADFRRTMPRPKDAA